MCSAISMTDHFWLATPLLVERFPRLVFHQRNKRNNSEIVYMENLCKGIVAEHYLIKRRQSNLAKRAETEDDVVDDRGF